MPQFIFILIAGFSLYVLWYACRTKWQVMIDVEPGKATRIVGAPAAKMKVLEEFFAQDIAFPGRTRIYVRRNSPGTMKTKIRGELDPGTRQRIRNFLITCL